LEAFANLYRNFANTIGAIESGNVPSSENLDFPGIKEGIRGMAFITHMIQSGQAEQKWIDFTL
jgi:hypothetical protein